MKTEDLKALGLSDEQVQRVFAMNGEEMNGLKASVATLTAERDTARTSLADANKKLEGYDPEWKAKAAQAQQQADKQVAELKAGYAADSAASGLKFTSDSAKKAFLSDLKAKNLPLQDDGTLLGFDDYVASYKKTDPGAFAPEGGLPRVSSSATGTPAGPTTNEQANAAIRAVFGHR
ncbi:phage scaffolding protein [uncultured Subdoligranulum sp.]|uniref:phage scaffolding protein n=1 Tax=uncultured Subdoligranulum sp. TaxID=512298 RepID=UPI00261CFEBF|nr:phage scaffolding protein [uncultured Subdoligranulum sp.]